jgi:hypothetical protein
MTLPTGIPKVLLEPCQGLDALNIEVKFGRKHLKDNSAPPRVVFYPTKDPIGDAVPLSTATYRSIRTLSKSFNAFIWGRSYDQADAIARAIVRLVHQYNLASCDFGTLEWNVKADESVTVDGHGCLLPIVIRTPITSNVVPIPAAEGDQQADPTGETTVEIVATNPQANEAVIEPGTVTFSKPTPP